MAAEALMNGENSVLTFERGLIGMPQLQRMVLASQPEVEPFLWLTPADDQSIAFLVIDPRLIVPNYTFKVPEDVRRLLNFANEEELVVMAIAIIAPEWAASTVNLYAPLVICPSTMRGAQVALADSDYRVDHPLVQADENRGERLVKTLH